MTKRCGYIAIMGRPNAGKSSLLNTLVGHKIAGVSAKPQTTRNRILGIRMEGDSQLLFLDTPGIHRQQKRLALNSMMNREAWAVLADADCVVYLIDGEDSERHSDREFLRNVIRDYAGPIYVCVNKTDKMKQFEVDSQLRLSEHMIEEILTTLPEDVNVRMKQRKAWPISAKRRETLQPLLDTIAAALPEGDWLYPEDDLTDRSQKFVASELIREQAFRCLGAELPYHLAVRVEEITWSDTLVRVEAELIVGRMQHKGIVLGKGGQKIKEIGSKARMSLEQHFANKVFLGLEVLVDEGWVNDKRSIADYSELGEFQI